MNAASLDNVYMPATGMAEIVFKYKDDALEAFKKYNQRNLDGQPMVCRVHPTSRSRLSGYGHRCVITYLSLSEIDLFTAILTTSMASL